MLSHAALDARPLVNATFASVAELARDARAPTVFALAQPPAAQTRCATAPVPFAPLTTRGGGAKPSAPTFEALFTRAAHEALRARYHAIARDATDAHGRERRAPEREATERIWGNATWRIAVHFRTHWFSTHSVCVRARARRARAARAPRSPRPSFAPSPRARRGRGRRQKSLTLSPCVTQVDRRVPDWNMEDHARALLRALAPSLPHTRVALVASFQETEDAQRMVRDGMERLRAEFPAQVVVATSEVPYETHKGYARVDALARDLAVLATSHVLVVGRSQFSVLAALLQRPDGVHVTTGPKQLVDASGCHYFASTLVVGRHTDAATGATRGIVPGLDEAGGDFAAFLNGARKHARAMQCDIGRIREAHERAALVTSFGACVDDGVKRLDREHPGWDAKGGKPPAKPAGGWHLKPPNGFPGKPPPGYPGTPDDASARSRAEQSPPQPRAGRGELR